jgi:hypothetical protein
MAKEKFYVSKVEDEKGRKFFYIPFGSEVHGKISFRLWVSPHLLEEDEKGGLYVEFPVQGARLKKGKNEKSWILIPDVGYWTAHYYIPCGYRGNSSFSVLEPNEYMVAKFYEYHSPRGALGISEGGLISVPIANEYIKIKWSRSGRTYGNEKEGCSILFKNGEEKTIPLEICQCDDKELKNLECELGLEGGESDV